MTPSGLVFVDTNVFAYALDHSDAAKRDVARAAIDALRDRLVVSTQVLIELYAVATRKLGLTQEAARNAVELVSTFQVVAADRALVLAALEISGRAGISIFDAMIVAAALRAGCAAVLTEDLNAGQVFDGVQIENPFARSP